MTVDIRAGRPADLPGVLAVVDDAFGRGGRVPALTAALCARTDTQAGVVAVDGAHVVGYTHLSVSWIDAANRVVEVLALSPLAVAPAYRSRGIGRRLLAAATAAGARLRAPAIFLEGDPAYYGPHGWRPAGDLGFEPPSTRIPAAAFQVVTLDTYDGSVRGRLVYNDTFWAHDCVGLR